jgi:hypothetical protein
MSQRAGQKRGHRVNRRFVGFSESGVCRIAKRLVEVGKATHASGHRELPWRVWKGSMRVRSRGESYISVCDASARRAVRPFGQLRPEVQSGGQALGHEGTRERPSLLPDLPLSGSAGPLSSVPGEDGDGPTTRQQPAGSASLAALSASMTSAATTSASTCLPAARVSCAVTYASCIRPSAARTVVW